ncbi:MAG: hypothetical protein K2P78_13585 [Gemmataceae bacterium]|nr:hypothetical protein [Gemmataceae bacterium]
MSPATRPLWKSPAVLYTALAAAFITFRLILATVGTAASEYRLYYEYGDAARRSSLDDLYHEQDIEYPQLAVLFGTLTGCVADHLPDDADRWTYARPNPLGPPDYARFEAALAVVLGAVDVACLALVYLIARRFYPDEGHPRRALRLFVYTLTTGALGFILYDRQDLVVAMFALLALLALAYGWSFPGYMLLTVCTAYKLVGGLLLPVWVFAAAALRTGPNATPGRFLRAVLIEAAVSAIVLVLWPVVTYEFGGRDRAFTFLTFHSARGLQIEAPLAWPTILLDPAADVTHGYGSFNFHSALADRVAGVLKWAMVGSVVVGTLLAGRLLFRKAAAPRPLTPARLGPVVVAACLVMWLGFILANKVGSPQYLLWVAPLVPLLPLKRAREWWWVGLMLAVMVMTTAIYPCAYEFVKGKEFPPHSGTWLGPNVWTKILLTARSVGLAAATLWLAGSVWRAGRPNPVPSISAPARSTRHEPELAPCPLTFRTA